MLSKRSTLVAVPTKLIRVLAVSLAALVVAAMAASPAGATFGAPLDLSASGQDADSPQVAVDADGDAVFTWLRRDAGGKLQAQTRARSAAGVLSPVQGLSPTGLIAFDPGGVQVAVDADGDAVFAWPRADGANDRIQARARSAAGVLSPVQNISEAGQDAFFPEVAVDADGDAVFTWARFDGNNWRIQARARSAAGVLSPVQDLSAAGQDAFNLPCACPRPQVAVDPGGDAVFAWSRSDGAVFRAQTRARSAAGALSAVQTLSSAGQHALAPQVGVDTSGDAVFAWSRSDGPDDRIQTRARSAVGALSGVQNLSPSGGDAAAPQVGVDADGDAVFTWYRSDGAHFRIQARRRSSGGALSAVQDLSAAGQNASSPQVAVDAGGDAVFTWLRPDHIDTVLGTVYVVQARERTAAGALSAVQTLSDAAQSVSSISSPEVAVDPDGDAASVWSRPDGMNRRIQTARGP